MSAGSLLLGLGILIATGPARAQTEAEQDEPGGTTEVRPLSDLEDTSAAFGNIDAGKVPIADKKSRVEAMLLTQRNTLARVTEILGEARSSKDIVQLNCVNEKLTQIKGLLKISEQASLSMYEGIASEAKDIVNHEYTKIVVAHQKSQVLRAEAEQCVGENSVYAGDTSVDVEIEEGGGGFGGGDPTTASAPPPGPAVPPLASTF